MKYRVGFINLILGWGLCAGAAAAQVRGPEASARSNASNYKDMVLSTCIARAYQDQGTVAADAGSSASALVEWTLYDAEKSPDEVERLIGQYLRRDYSNPLAETERKGLQFQLLKCLDLYHSKELESLVRRIVIKPNSSFRRQGR